MNSFISVLFDIIILALNIIAIKTAQVMSVWNQLSYAPHKCSTFLPVNIPYILHDIGYEPT